jgi:hypothetical protein
MRIVRPDGTVVEGSPQELAQYEGLLSFNSPKRVVVHTGSVAPQSEVNDAENFRFVSSDVAFRALTRIKLSEKQILVLIKMHEAGTGWITGTALQQAIGYSASQFAGLMGAFGRRVIYTPGYVMDSAFFEQEWNEVGSCYSYRLPPSVREAVERARIVG